MDLTYFRLLDFKPDELQILKANSKYFCLLHGTSTISFYTLNNFKHVVTLELPFDVNCINFYNECILLCGTQCGRIVYVDVLTLEFSEFIVGSAVKFLDVMNEIIIFCDMNNHVSEIKLEKNNLKAVEINCINENTNKENITNRKDNKFNKYKIEDIEATEGDILKVKKKMKIRNNITYFDFKVKQIERLFTNPEDITCVTVTKRLFVFLDSTGYLKIIKKGKMEKEFFVSNEIFTRIERIEDNTFCLISESGGLFVLDTEKEYVITQASVRDTALLALCVIGNEIYCAGEDNRVINYNYSHERLNRGQQTDNQYAKIVDMLASKGRVVTISADFSVGFYFLKGQNYQVRKVVANKDLIKAEKDIIIVRNNKKLDVYKILRDLKDVNTDDRHICYFNKRKYRHLASLASEKEICSHSISQNGCYFAFLTQAQTFLFEIKEDKCLLTNRFEGACKSIFFNGLFCYITYKRNLVFYCLDSKTDRYNLLLDSFDDDLYVCNNQLILSDKKLIFDSNLNMKELKYSGLIEAVASNNQNTYILEIDPSFSIYIDYNIYQFNQETGEKIKKGVVTMTLSLDGMFMINNYIVCYNHERIYVRNINNRYTDDRHLGPVIYGACFFDNSILVGQRNYEDILGSLYNNKKVKLKWQNKFINK